MPALSDLRDRRCHLLGTVSTITPDVGMRFALAGVWLGLDARLVVVGGETVSYAG
jgi:hypothetical protein